MTHKLNIQPWTTDDVLFAKRMTDIEKWGNTEADFHRMRKIQPDGCFVARHGDTTVGMITALAYGRYGYLGSLIVPSEYRQQGIGEKLMLHGKEFLRSLGVVSIELDAVMEAAALYRRLGFKDKYHSLRFYRSPAAVGRTASNDGDPTVFRSLDPSDIPQLLALDYKLTKLERRKALEAVIDEFPEHVYGSFDSDGNLESYLVVRPMDPGRFFFGPMVACDNAVGISLLKSALELYGLKEIRTGVPAPAGHVCHWLLRQGFLRQPPSLRMYSGPMLQYEEHIGTILSPEKG